MDPPTPFAVPVPTTSFVGRVEELSRLSEHQEGWLTIVGAPGIGKSRLAMEAARASRDRGNTVAFCDLRRARDLPDARRLLLQSIGAASRGIDSDPDEAIARLLASSHYDLVVLDNLEHLLPDAASSIERWTDSSRIALIATSRSKVTFAVERVLSLEPLALPDHHDDAAQSDAVVLFIEAARRARPTYRPLEHELRAIVDIVRELAGLPLAIELAASRLTVLDAQRLAERVRADLTLVSDAGTADVVTSLEWSLEDAWRRLTPAEQLTLGTCSLFRGSFEAETAEKILRAVTGDLSPLDSLASLRAKSLVQSEEDGTDRQRVRLRLLTPIRRFAAARLAAGEHADIAVTTFTSHFARRASEWRARALRSGLRADVDALELELDDILASAEIARTRGQSALRLELLAGVANYLLEYWSNLDALRVMDALDVEELDREGAHRCAELFLIRTRMERQIEKDGDHGSVAAALALAEKHDLESVRVDVLRARGHSAHIAGNIDEAVELLRRACATQPQARLAGLSELALADALRSRAAPEEALPHAQRATARLDEEGYAWERARVRHVHAMILLGLGASAEARDMLTPLVDGSSDANASIAEMSLGLACLATGETQRAARHLERAARELRRLEMRFHAAYAEGNQGLAAALDGQPEVAREHFVRSIAALDELDAGVHANNFRLYLAVVQMGGGQPERAAASLSAGEGELLDADMIASKLVVEAAIDGGSATLDDLCAAIEAVERTETIDEAVRLVLRQTREALRSSTRAEPPDVGLPVSTRLLLSYLTPPDDGARTRLRVSRDGRKFAVGVEPTIDIGSRASLARILARLFRERANHAPEPLTITDLFEVGWPGETAHPEAARHRVYVALSTLRKLGLRGWLVRHGGGYVLSGAVELTEHEVLD